MLVQPFIFGNVDGDLNAEFVDLDHWNAAFLGQSDPIGNNLAVLASVTTAHIHSDSRLFNDGYHLQTLLNSIDGCYPFVYFILGDTYGTAYIDARHGKGERNIQTAVNLGHTWLLDPKIRHASLLHILIQYATLKASAHDSKNDADDDGKPSPFIYIRRPSYERSIYLLSENGRFAHQRAPTVLADAVRFDNLKREILGNDLRMRFFDNSKQMINQILADIHRCVNKTAILQTSSLIQTPTLDQLSDELTRRVDFANVERSDSSQSAIIEESSQVPAGKIVTLVSEARSGKHLLLHSWLAQFSESNPGVPVFTFRADADSPHFEMNSVVFLMDGAINKFRSFHKEFDMTLRESRVIEALEARQMHQIEQEFGASLALGPCLLVIMGLDFVSSGRYFGSDAEVKVKQLHWIPEKLPPHCRIIVTTTSNDMTLKALLKRSDVDVMDVSALAQDPVFKETFLRSQTVAFSKFPRQLVSTILASPTAGSVIHLAAIGRILANHDMLHRLEYQVECILEHTRLRDLFAHELRKWTGLANPLAPPVPGAAPEDPDRSVSWIPVFLRFMVLSRYGLPTRSIMPMLRLVMAIKKQSHNQKVVERWCSFWQSASFLFRAGPRNTLKLVSEGARRSLAAVLFDSGTNSFSVWRRRYIRFLQSLPNSASDTVVIDEQIIQADQSDDYVGLMRLLSDGNSFARLANGKRSQVFTLSILLRIEGNSNGLFRYLVARWLNKLGVLSENVVGDSTDRSDRASSHRSNRTTTFSETSSEPDLITLPDGQVARSDFAWLISDWLFAITKISPTDADHQVTVNLFVNLIPMVAKFCENELGQVPFDAEAYSRLAGFLMRCSARFSAPRFNNIKLALETMQYAAKLFLDCDQHLNNQARSNIEEIAKTAETIDELSRLINKVDSQPMERFHKLVRFSYIVAQLESCEMCFKINDTEAARLAIESVDPFLEINGQAAWPPIIFRHLFCLSLFSQSSTNAEQCERFLRAAADASTKWYGRKHPAVADTLLALGCILASRATMPKRERAHSAYSFRSSRPSTAVEGLQHVFDSLFTSEEVEQCFRESIAILDERRLYVGGDTERLSFACASLGRFLSHLPTSASKREAADLLQKAADLALLESGQEDFTVKWLRTLTKDTLLAMPPVWFSELQRQQNAEDAGFSNTRPFSSRLHSRLHSRQISATALNISQNGDSAMPTRTRPATTQAIINSRPTTAFNRSHSASRKLRPKTSIGLPSEYR